RPLDQDVAALAVLAADGEDAGGRVLYAVREQCGVAGAVQRRARVVGHAAVDRDPGGRAAALDDADAVEGEAGAADERAAGLEDELRPGEAERRPRLLDPLGQRA